MSSATARSGGRERVLDRAESLLDRPTATYYLILTVTGLLVVFGLFMVLSASSIDSLVKTKNGTAYSIFFGQLRYAVIGAVALLVAAKVPIRLWKVLALGILLVGMGLQGAVLLLSKGFQGNNNWLNVGPVSIQPSELIKVGLALTGGLLLAPRLRLLGRVRHAFVPYVVPFAGLAIGLVMAGNDLGTVLILLAIVGGVLFTAGLPLRWFAAAAGLVGAGVVAMIVAFPHRLQRFDVWLGRDTNVYGNARQPIYGKYALADGGWFGLGPGASREKWQYLSEPHNDFIFAIIGEELGLPGTIAVLLLFLALIYACYRLVLRTSDDFVRIAAAGIGTWIAVQAIINIGSVTGLLPVIGVPLPLVSSGGSSLITTMGALGILLAFARTEPGCDDALRGQARWWGRFLPDRWVNRGVSA